MTDAWRQVLDKVRESFAGNWFLLLWIVALIYLFFAEKEKRKLLVYPSILLGVLIFNPLLYRYCWRKLFDYAYWRAFWMVPVLPVIAAATVSLACRVRKNFMKAAVIVLAFAVSAATGTFIYKDRFVRAQNLYKLPQVTINNKKVLLHDGQTIEIGGVRIECFLVPGHTWGHMVYLIDDKYLFTGDTLWFGADGGYSFISALAEDNRLAVRSLDALEEKLRARGIRPLFITGHTGWTDNFEFAFAHKDKLCSPFRKRVPDPGAPYDAYDESDDTKERALSGFLRGVGR